MKTGVLTLSFGEPAEPTLEEVIPYLERIFLANASLEDDTSEEAVRRRSRELAERRAPGLMEEYDEIGGSPLNAQAGAHARSLESELRGRGHEARTYVGMQFTEPFVRDAVSEARDDGVERLVVLPVYPLCGESTTVSALRDAARAVADLGWDVELHEISGWHRHPVYLRIRADNVLETAGEHGLDLDASGTCLVFSAHGTPLRYLDEGNRYVEYVEDCCREVADLSVVEDYELGYQNHSTRGVPWTEPEIEDVVRELDAERALVVPISFMHEQSETLSELDVELREEAETRGLEFVRAPVPHDDERFPGVLADLVESVLPGENPEGLQASPCRCRATSATRCLNAGLDAAGED